MTAPKPPSERGDGSRAEALLELDRLLAETRFDRDDFDQLLSEHDGDGGLDLANRDAAQLVAAGLDQVVVGYEGLLRELRSEVPS